MGATTTRRLTRRFTAVLHRRSARCKTKENVHTYNIGTYNIGMYNIGMYNIGMYNIGMYNIGM